jgi:Tfp pilus assembly pilus retraction ATPase PilT
MRMLDAFPEEQQDFVASQLANSLKGVICQSDAAPGSGPAA